MSDSIGFYGKIPSVGDFIHRRLPAEFVSAWDGWLQDLIVNSREVLGQDWLDRYMVAPPWRFVVAPGIVGPLAWMGLVTPSVDRVGRNFPFTLAMPLPANVDPGATFLAANGWFATLETVAAEALQHQLDMAAWDRRLTGIAPPPLLLAELLDDATVPLIKKLAGPMAMPMAGTDPAFLLARVMAAFRRPYSLFSAVADEREGRILLATEGLPDKARSCALLDGCWSARGWQEPGSATPPAPARSLGQAPVPAAEPAAAPAAAPAPLPAPAVVGTAPVAEAGPLLDMLAPAGSLLDMVLGAAPSSGVLLDIPPAAAAVPVDTREAMPAAALAPAQGAVPVATPAPAAVPVLAAVPAPLPMQAVAEPVAVLASGPLLDMLAPSGSLLDMVLGVAPSSGSLLDLALAPATGSSPDLPPGVAAVPADAQGPRPTDLADAGAPAPRHPADDTLPLTDRSRGAPNLRPDV